MDRGRRRPWAGALPPTRSRLPPRRNPRDLRTAAGVRGPALGANPRACSWSRGRARLRRIHVGGRLRERCARYSL